MDMFYFHSSILLDALSAAQRGTSSLLLGTYLGKGRNPILFRFFFFIVLVLLCTLSFCENAHFAPAHLLTRLSSWSLELMDRQFALISVYLLEVGGRGGVMSSGVANLIHDH